MSAHRVGLAPMSVGDALTLLAAASDPHRPIVFHLSREAYDSLRIAPEPQPCQPTLNLSETTWGIGGPETRRSRTASATFVPVLGYPDPSPFEAFRLFGRWHR